MYWVVVLNEMQMPGEWLVGTSVVAIINLWAWREPLILVLIVVVGVLLLTIVGWLVSNLPWEGIVAVVILLAGLITYGVILLRNRQSKEVR
jgi:CHASE2 domain-containing sensor protein